MNCTRCNTVNQPTAKFCTNCGAALGATAIGERTQVIQNPGTNRAITNQPVVDNHHTTVLEPNQRRPSVVLSLAGASPSEAGSREQTILVIDKSGSMQERYDTNRDKITAARRGSMSLVLNRAMIDPNDEIGIVAFDTDARRLHELSPLHSRKDQIISAIRSIPADGGTDQNEGFKAARDMFDWSQTNVSRRIIMMTDGQGGEPLATAQDLKSRGVVIEVFGIGDTPSRVNEKLLRMVASTVAGENKYRFIKDEQTLIDGLTRLGEKHQAMAAAH